MRARVTLQSGYIEKLEDEQSGFAGVLRTFVFGCNRVSALCSMESMRVASHLLLACNTAQQSVNDGRSAGGSGYPSPAMSSRPSGELGNASPEAKSMVLDSPDRAALGSSRLTAAAWDARLAWT